MLLFFRLNMLCWARCLLKCTKINGARPSLTFRGWFGVDPPAQPEPEMLLSELAEGSPAPRRPSMPSSPPGFAGLLGLRLQPSFPSRPWALGSSSPGLPANIAGDLRPSAAPEQSTSRRCPSTSAGPLRSTLCFSGLHGWELSREVIDLLLSSACPGTGCTLAFGWKSGVTRPAQQLVDTLKIPPSAVSFSAWACPC